MARSRKSERNVKRIVNLGMGTFSGLDQVPDEPGSLLLADRVVEQLLELVDDEKHTSRVVGLPTTKQTFGTFDRLTLVAFAERTGVAIVDEVRRVEQVSEAGVGEKIGEWWTVG